MNKKVTVTAIRCENVEQMKNVLLTMHRLGYKHPNGHAMLHNVWLPDEEFNRGMRFVNYYSDSSKVKFAAREHGLKNGKNCQIVSATEFLKANKK
jgi:hypothetical protein